jgi:modulator of FtsH protease
MTAYDGSEWTDFFVAGAGASAALAGLVFVAVSINVDRILGFRGLPERALATVMLLLSVVLVSLIGLIPGQSRAALAGELLGVGLVFAALILGLTGRSMAGRHRQRAHAVALWLLVGLGTVPVVLGAVSLLAAAGGGLYWVTAGIVLATTGAVVNAWVLLVESGANGLGATSPRSSPAGGLRRAALLSTMAVADRVLVPGPEPARSWLVTRWRPNRPGAPSDAGRSTERTEKERGLR